MESKRQPRRSTEEIRARLIDAARELFAEKGFAATTTRDICRRSGVAPTQLFHNFGSKQGLFEAAFMMPLTDLVNEYVAGFDPVQQQSTLEERVATLVNGLFDIASANRTILLTALCQSALTPDRQAAQSDLLDHIAQTLHRIEIIDEPPPGIDVPAAIISTAAMVFGTVLLESMLVPIGVPRLDRERLTTEMVTMILQGALHRTTSDE